jgi:hypothetical protein
MYFVSAHANYVYWQKHFKNKKVKEFQKQHPDFLDWTKVWLCFLGQIMCGWNCSELLTFASQECLYLSHVIVSTIVSAPERSPAPFQIPSQNNPRALLKVSLVFMQQDISHTMSETWMYIFFKQSQPAMPNYLLPKAFG